jgi:hypothetical protein
MAEKGRQVSFTIPEELADRVEELAEKCGVPSVNVACVCLKLVTEIAMDDEGLEYLQSHEPLLKPDVVDTDIVN